MRRLLLLCMLPLTALAQNYAPARTDWAVAGYAGSKPVFSQTIDVLNYGADNAGLRSCNTAMTAAMNALNGRPGVIYFPPGVYFFDAAITINRDSIVFRGAGHDSTILRFDLGGQLNNLVNIAGTATTDTTSLTAAAIRGTYAVTLADGAQFRAGDWVRLSMDDRAYITSSWALGALSELKQIQGVSGNTVTFKTPFRFNYSLGNRPAIRRIVPANNIGFECLTIQRTDPTAGQASNIAFDAAVNCWIAGVESDSANFAHIEINRSSNIEIAHCYFHDAFAYGGGGQGYGVLLQFGTNECKVEANYFDHLRHSMLMQAGANGNVVAYNYSTHPFWTEPALPDSSAGDLVLHGDYPFMNLLEGNFVRNIVIDDSHGENGPLNTFFRNRADGFGVFMNFSPATDSVQFIGNEITNNAVGLYFISGKGHFQYGNNYRGTITGGGTANIPDTSLYLAPGRKPMCPNGYSAWPVVGRPGGYNTGSIYARSRVSIGKPAVCNCVDIPIMTSAAEATALPPWSIYPNPARDHFVVKGEAVERIEVYDIAGRRVMSMPRPADNNVSIADLVPGIYTVRLIGVEKAATSLLVKTGSL